MVSICLEYVEDSADMIYLYCSFEPNVISADVFYRINGVCVRKHNINNAPGNHPVYTTTVENQSTVIQILMDDLKAIKQLCDNYQKPMPTEIKVYYNVNNKSLDAKYKYDPVYSNDPVKTADDVFDEWFLEEEQLDK